MCCQTQAVQQVPGHKQFGLIVSSQIEALIPELQSLQIGGQYHRLFGRDLQAVLS
jgi:hypothetical protein